MRYLNFQIFILLLVFCSIGALANAADKPEIYSNSGLELPRFVSLAESKTNVRAGPGQKYPIKWVLNRKSLPVEVILEFDHWRKIIDHEGQSGWVFHALLSGKRTGIIIGSDPVPAYEKPYDNNDKKTRVTIELEPQVQVKLDECSGAWCNVSTSGFSGWIKRKSIWGVYEHEEID